MRTHPLPDICTRIAVDSERIHQRVVELGQQIVRETGSGEIHLVTVLKGGLFFLADLCRAIPADVRLDFLAVSPYAPNHPGTVRITKDLDDAIAGATVVLVEDVVDTGLTVNYILSSLASRGPNRLLVCSLLDKPARRIAPINIDFTGFELDDDFVVGYGLDVNGRYRNLPYVAALRPEAVLR